jgi:hypothetical protein
MKTLLLFVPVLVGTVNAAAAQTGGYIAGLQPDRRPDTAPRLTEVVRTPAQLARALYGIEKPVPGNVESIAATGNWWVPLRHPGMTGAYDLRGWHTSSAATIEAPASVPSITGSSAH